MSIENILYLVLISCTALLLLMTYIDSKNLRKHIKQYKEISRNMNDTIKSLDEFKNVVDSFLKKNNDKIVKDINKIKKDILKMKTIIDNTKK